MTVGNKVSAVICAGGKGTRAGFSKNKLLKNVLGIPVLERTLAAFSLPEIDEIRILPIPGIENTCSMITLPAIISVSVIARNVTTGIMAFFKTCLYKIPFVLFPLLYAVLT